MNVFRTGLMIAGLTALFLLCGFLMGGEAGMLFALVMAIAMNGLKYWNSDKIVLHMYNARKVNKRSAPNLYGIVEQLVATADLPMPRAYLFDHRQPNAFGDRSES